MTDGTSFDNELNQAIVETAPAPRPLIPSGLYDAAKWCTLIGLPAFATLYSALAPIWNFPGAGQVSQTVAAVCTFLGVLLGISTAHYNRHEVGIGGTLNLSVDEANLALNTRPVVGDEITVKVR